MSRPPADDVLTSLLAADLGGESLRGHVLGLLFAGNETTAAAMAWALVNAARHPSAWASVRSDSTLVAAFTDETLRLTPAVWGFARSPLVRHATINAGAISSPISKREIVTIYLRGLNRNPALWPDPELFRIDRHARPSSEQQRGLLPFGLGPRGCIGQHLALAEIHATLPVLARVGDVVLDREPHESPAFALRFTDGLRGRFVRPASAENAVHRRDDAAAKRSADGD